MKNIANIQISSRDLNNQILKSDGIIAKLTEVENKFESIVNIEKQIHDKDCILENLITKVNAIENKLKEKDETIKDLSDKLDSLFENKATEETEETEDNVVKDSEIEKTFCNPSDIL